MNCCDLEQHNFNICMIVLFAFSFFLSSVFYCPCFINKVIIRGIIQQPKPLKNAHLNLDAWSLEMSATGAKN